MTPLERAEADMRDFRNAVADELGRAYVERDRLRDLALDMGRAIRRLDEDHEHLEFWTQDDGYVLDGRFPRG